MKDKKMAPYENLFATRAEYLNWLLRQSQPATLWCSRISMVLIDGQRCRELLEEFRDLGGPVGEVEDPIRSRLLRQLDILERQQTNFRGSVWAEDNLSYYIERTKLGL